YPSPVFVGSVGGLSAARMLTLLKGFRRGSWLIAAADVTPGSDLTPSRKEAKKAEPRTSEYFPGGSGTSTVSSLWALKPGFARCSESKLRRRSPAKTSRAIERATCPATNPLRTRDPRPREPRPLDRRPCARLMFRVCHAGIRPNPNQVKTV